MKIKIHLDKLRLGGVASGYWAQPVTLPSGSASHWGSSPHLPHVTRHNRFARGGFALDEGSARFKISVDRLRLVQTQ